MSAQGQAPAKPRVAVFKMASCDGCQLQLLDAEEALLELAGAIEIVNFAEATSFVEPGPYDVTLVEGSISTSDQIEQVKAIRAESTFLITIGACATSGGIQALRNGTDLAEHVRYVYPTPAYVDALADSRPIAEVVPVDLELTGCPVDRGQLLAALAWLLQGSVPRPPTTPVCIECKRARVRLRGRGQGRAVPRPRHPHRVRRDLSRGWAAGATDASVRRSRRTPRRSRGGSSSSA